MLGKRGKEGVGGGGGVGGERGKRVKVGCGVCFVGLGKGGYVGEGQK